MAFLVPTSKQKFTQYLSIFENKLNQTSPLADKAFLRVLSAVLALEMIEVFKFAAERALQNLAITATGEDLRALGRNYNVPFSDDTNAVITANLPAVDTTIISATATFIGVNNGLRYFIQNSVIADVTNNAEITLIAEDPGVSGNLEDGEPLTITSSIPGAEDVAVVGIIAANPSSTIVTGANAESDDDYRVKVLDEIRRIGGGGNSSDYRRWALEVSGVRRIYPYSGEPFGQGGSSFPPDRTIYVEVDESLDPDGIPSAGILTQVREAITTDPESLETRQPLGLTDETLFIVPITTFSIAIQVHNVIVDNDDEVVAINAITNALANYVKSVRPFVPGLDPEEDRKDLVTQVTLSDVVQDALTPLGGTAEHVFFGPAIDSFIDSKQLDPGEILILGIIDFV